jgi:hypothetical protein
VVPGVDGVGLDITIEVTLDGIETLGVEEITKGVNDAVTEPPLYVGNTVTTIWDTAQPKYVSSVCGKTKRSYWQ